MLERTDGVDAPTSAGSCAKESYDLFCWHPDNGEWFFAEAKGKDHLRESQHKWFKICRETLPNADIRVYRLEPLAKS
jgi:hypothetical protein